jgi:hypothetical protein
MLIELDHNVMADARKTVFVNGRVGRAEMWGVGSSVRFRQPVSVLEWLVAGLLIPCSVPPSRGLVQSHSNWALPLYVPRYRASRGTHTILTEFSWVSLVLPGKYLHSISDYATSVSLCVLSNSFCNRPTIRRYISWDSASVVKQTINKYVYTRRQIPQNRRVIIVKSKNVNLPIYVPWASSVHQSCYVHQKYVSSCVKPSKLFRFRMYPCVTMVNVKSSLYLIK